jgi:hypothetical protein
VRIGVEFLPQVEQVLRVRQFAQHEIREFPMAVGKLDGNPQRHALGPRLDGAGELNRRPHLRRIGFAEIDPRQLDHRRHWHMPAGGEEKRGGDDRAGPFALARTEAMHSGNPMIDI